MTSRALRARLWLFAFVDEFGPLYSLYAVWFAANGMSAAQISGVFVFWAAAGLVAEVPSGALADRVERRWLIAAAMLLRAAGIALWLVWPTTAGIVIGAGLWAVHSALASGTWEALVYDLLAERGEAGDYGPVAARVGQASQGGIALGALLGALLLHLGMGMVGLGWITVAVHALSVAVILSLPPARPAPDPEDDGGAEGLTLAAWWQTLRAGVRAAGAEPLRLRLLIVGVLLEGLFILDEYQPLLAAARGAEEAVVPLLVLAVWLGLILGGEVAARRPALRGAGVGGLLIATSLLVIGALWSGGLWALALLGVGYGAQNIAWILADARFQARIPDHVRATVTSVRAFLGAGINILAFGTIAALSADEDPAPGLVPLLGVLALTGALIIAWLPPHVASGGE